MFLISFVGSVGAGVMHKSLRESRVAVGRILCSVRPFDRSVSVYYERRLGSIQSTLIFWTTYEMWGLVP